MLDTLMHKLVVCFCKGFRVSMYSLNVVRALRKVGNISYLCRIS